MALGEEAIGGLRRRELGAPLLCCAVGPKSQEFLLVPGPGVDCNRVPDCLFSPS